MTTTPTTRERIYSIVQDGKPRSLAELHKELAPAKWYAVQSAFELMLKKGEFHVAAGHAFKPAKGHTARRYVLNQEVAA